MEMISPVALRTCRLLGLTRSTVTLCEAEMDDISYDDRPRNFCIAARTSPVASADAGAAASVNSAPSANAATNFERINGCSSSIAADVPDHAEVALRERAERDQRLGGGDPGMRGDSLGDEIAELVVLAHAHDRDQIVRSGDAIALGDAVDLEQFFGQRPHPAGFDGHQDDRGDHEDGPTAAARRSPATRPRRPPR